MIRLGATNHVAVTGSGIRWRAYALAVALVVAGLLARLALETVLGQSLPFLTLFPAVFIAALLGGLGPGLFATALATAAALGWIMPGPATTVPTLAARLVGSSLFMLSGAGAALLGELRLRSYHRALAETARADREAAIARAALAEAERATELAEEEAARAEEEAARAEEEATAAELAAAEVDAARHEFAEFFEQAAIACHWLAPDGTIVRVNRAELDLLGLTAAACVGRRMRDFHDDPAECDALLARMARGEELHDVPARVRTADGRVRQVLLTSSTARDAAGAPRLFRCFARDVTDQREAEDAMRMLQRLDSVGRLAGGVAHEVNNQMSIVLGAASFILRQDKLPSSVAGDAEMIRAAAERTAGITRQLLAFGRRQHLEPGIHAVHEVIRDFEPVIRRALGEERQLALEFGADEDAATVDRAQLEQVLLNLVLNAVDAMPAGGRLAVTTSVATLAERDRRLPGEPSVVPGRYVVVQVSDTGAGMDPGTMSRIFEPFFTTKERGSGTGLGLSTVYGIVRQSGGYVNVESRQGQGSTFSVYLPLTGAAEPTTEVRPHATGSRRARILVVEDEPAVRTIAARVLTDAGFIVEEAANAREALDRVRHAAASVELVLTDVVMPGMRGEELARLLAAERPDLPVLLMTGYAASVDLHAQLDNSDGELIEKPFDPAMLARRVREALSRLPTH